MKRTLRFFIAGLAVSWACAPAPSPETANDAELLQEIVDSYWQYLFENDVERRVTYGAEIERLHDWSLAKARERSEVARRHLDRLAEIRPENLDHGDWVTFEVLRWDLDLEAERSRFYWLEIPITPRPVRATYFPSVFERFNFEEPADLDGYLRLLDQVAPYLESVQTKLRGQAERGIVVPRAEIEILLPIWRALRGEGEQSPFYVAADRLAGLAVAHPEEVAAFEAEVSRRIGSTVEPAVERLLDYLTGDYAGKAPETVGFAQYPGGVDYYRFVARYFTTLDSPPEEMHRKGLERAAALVTEMDELRRSMGFEGTREELHRFLKTDPRFLATTPEEVEARFRAYLEKIEPHIDAYFSRRPRAPYALERLARELESGATYGYYDPPKDTDLVGRYYYNGSRLDQRPLFGAASMIYHELMPGHHMQVSLQFENHNLPLYRQYNFYSAHAEGWAVYASGLAGEMGMYDDDPYQRYGRLASEARYAARVVVDTGLNALGWSFERANDFLRQNTLESETQVWTETLRYGADLPGQALAYRIGSQKIWELRRRAERELGERFDVRRFHDAILDYGPMPLKVLERHIEWFIERQKAGGIREASG